MKVKYYVYNSEIGMYEGTEDFNLTKRTYLLDSISELKNEVHIFVRLL